MTEPKQPRYNMNNSAILGSHEADKLINKQPQSSQDISLPTIPTRG